MKLLEEAITEWFGPRCPDQEPGCPCCDAWAEYDVIKAEIERLRAALAPLAALPIEDSPAADDVPLYGLDGCYITHGDIRRAKRIINKEAAE
jgi:hypothetical protein